jgi:hypothetical protein
LNSGGSNTDAELLQMCNHSVEDRKDRFNTASMEVSVGRETSSKPPGVTCSTVLVDSWQDSKVEVLVMNDHADASIFEEEVGLVVL